MIRITDILDRAQAYLSADDLAMIEKAYIFSASVHQGQVRLSGEPYLIHPLEVTGILVDMRLDAPTLITGLLHDTVEDTLATLDQIEEAFGKEVVFLVDGLTKLSKITFGSKLERQAENFRKMILAMSDDIRILMVRLADRIHNMRTLEYHGEDNRHFIATETLELYAPLANRLGINWMKTELEDLSFKYVNSEEYWNLVEKVAQKKEEREGYTEEVKSTIKKEISSYHLEADVEGRAKHLYSIFKKMQDQGINFDEVYDLIAFRVILDSNKVKECYEVLSIIHALWKPVPGRFKDYIAMPKANSYQSLHTTVIGPYGERLEVQIRTRKMHEWAEKGIASHWRYKEGRIIDDKDERQIQRLRELLDFQSEQMDPREFMRNLKLALYADEVYVFTPTGDVKSFPKGATPIDFAYAIHTDVGNQCVGAKVNRNIVPLKYALQNGDIVDIITQPGHNPSKDWLKYAVTSRAQTKIKQWIKTQERERSVEFGRSLLEKEAKKSHLTLNNVLKTEDVEKLMEEYSIETVDDLIALIGYGKISAKHIMNRVLHVEEKKEKKEKRANFIAEKVRKGLRRTAEAGISITGVDDVMVRFARCCNPLPGDDIIGYITRGRGVTVHVANCPRVGEMDSERVIDVKWNMDAAQTFPVNIRLSCIDKKGLLTELSNVISSLGINITYANVDTYLDSYATCDFQLQVSSLKEFNMVVKGLKKLKSVVSVERVRESFIKKDRHTS